MAYLLNRSTEVAVEDRDPQIYEKRMERLGLGDGSDEEKDGGGSEPGKRRSEGREEAIDGQNGTGSGER